MTPEQIKRMVERIERRIRELPAAASGGLAASNLGQLLSDELIKRIAKEAADETLNG